jgi:hypothetical protein
MISSFADNQPLASLTLLSASLHHHLPVQHHLSPTMPSALLTLLLCISLLLYLLPLPTTAADHSYKICSLPNFTGSCLTHTFGPPATNPNPTFSSPTDRSACIPFNAPPPSTRSWSPQSLHVSAGVVCLFNKTKSCTCGPKNCLRGSLGDQLWWFEGEQTYGNLTSTKAGNWRPVLSMYCYEGAGAPRVTHEKDGTRVGG